MSYLKIGIDTSSVLALLQKRFGMDSFISTSFIQRVRETDEKTAQITTCAVDGNGTLWWNRAFFEKNINTPNKLEELLFHEMLHHVFGDLCRSPDYLHNFAADIVINSVVGRVLGHCDLMKSFYPGKVLPIEGLLRPESFIRADAKKLKPIYNTVWGFWDHRNKTFYNGNKVQDMEGGFSSIPELLDVLRILLSRYGGKRAGLLGGHGHQGDQTIGSGGPGEERTDAGGDGTEELDSEARAQLGGELGDLIANSQAAGHGDTLIDMVVKTIRANATLLTRLLNEFAIDSELSAVKKYMNVRVTKRAVFPRGSMGRRDAVMLGAGVLPLHYSVDRIRQKQQKRGIAIYVDVSGSVFHDLPRICGLIHAMRKEVDAIYEFSNQVYKTTTQRLGSGKIETTGGTDYDCIVEHAVQNTHRKIIVITDGFAGLSKKNEALALANIEKALVVYTKNHAKSEFWKKHYHRTLPLDKLFR
jgi:hypothetical protein